MKLPDNHAGDRACLQGGPRRDVDQAVGGGEGGEHMGALDPGGADGGVVVEVHAHEMTS